MSDLQWFLDQHRVFTWDEFLEELGQDRTEQTLRTIIRNYLNSQKIGRVKSGLYYRIKTKDKQSTPDKYLIGSKLAKDAVLGYHTAFEVLGYAHSVSSKVYVFTNSRVRPIEFQQVKYQPVSPPAPMSNNHTRQIGVEKKERLGTKVQITNKERTLVDVLDRPDYTGGLEELRRCIEKLPYVDFEEVMRYLEQRDKKVLFAKTGFILEQNRENWYVKGSWLETLQAKIPTSPTYFTPEDKGKLNSRWNLIVPESMYKRIDLT